MANTNLPDGCEHSLFESFLPNVKTTVELFAMHMRKVTNEWIYPSHEHLHFEINYVTDGQQVMTINGREYAQNRGDLLLIRPCQPHFSRAGHPDGFTYFCIHFIIDDKLLFPLLNNSGQNLFAHHTALAQGIRPSIEHLIKLSITAEELTVPAKLKIESAVFDLLARIGDCLLDEDQGQVPIHQKSLTLAKQIEERLVSAVNAVGAHGSSPDPRLRIEDVCRDLDISTSHCNRVFHSVYGVSPRQYLTEIVLQHAKVLLKSELPIEHIALHLGYADQSHFSRQFKRWTGLSPIQFRRSEVVD